MKINEAAQAALSLAKSYRAVLDLAEAVTAMGDVEGYLVEVSRETERLKTENTEALKQVTQTRAELDEANGRIRAAKAEALKIIADARVQADADIRAGNDQVRRMIADARAEVQQTQGAIAQAQDAHKQWMEATEVEKTKLLNSIEALKAEFAALKARLS